MNTSIAAFPVNSANTKPLWAAVGILGVAVLAMGASLVYVQTRPADHRAALVAMAPSIETEMAPPRKTAARDSALQQDEIEIAPKAPVVAKKPVVAKPRPLPAAAAPTPVARAPAPAAAPVVLAAPVAAPVAPLLVSQPVAKPTCANCGTIEAVTAVQRKGEAKGIGAVAGGVLGAVLGNQIGNGNGRTAATVLGALGGGLAGHAIEKNVKKETVYQVRVRMEDGSTRTIEQASLPSVGARVVVEGSAIHSADGSWSAPAAANPQPWPQPQTQTTQVFNRS